MKTCTCLLMTFAFVTEGFLVRGPSGPIDAPLAGSVLLPCTVVPPLPLDDLEVQWIRSDSGALVHLFQDNQSRPESQDQKYTDRVDFFPGEFLKGNYSVRLKHITMTDAGLYTCQVYSHDQQGEAVMEITEFGQLSGEVIFAIVMMGFGAVAAFLTSPVFQCCFFTVERRSSVLFHLCRIIVPNILLVIGIGCGGANLFDTYTTVHTTILSTELIVKHTVTFAIISLLRILLLFKMCPHLNTFPVVLKKTATALSIPVANLVFGIVSFGYVYAKGYFNPLEFLINMLSVVAVCFQVYDFIREPWLSSGFTFSSYIPVTYVLQTFIIFLLTGSNLWLFGETRWLLLKTVSEPYDIMFMFFLSVACIFNHESHQSVKHQMLVYEFGATLLPIVNGIFLSVVAFQLSMILGTYDFILLYPQTLVIAGESLLLIIWICFQVKFFFAVERRPGIITGEHEPLQTAYDYELSPEDNQNGPSMEEVVNDTEEVSMDN
ncbi:hypothetical protein ACEWY4_013021 [Coilia grayii]|uniref:Ig-like domain-containing protein n=1 Tax=Coilia grayii TaxID=363190 RepID=A0ABD1JV34_9TELE